MVLGQGRVVLAHGSVVLGHGRVVLANGRLILGHSRVVTSWKCGSWSWKSDSRSSNKLYHLIRTSIREHGSSSLQRRPKWSCSYSCRQAA